MTRFKGIIILLAILTILLSCVSSLSQTQAEMNQDACGQYKQADAELNMVYKEILNEYKSQAVFIRKLKSAQRAWLEFRDAHLNSVFPEQEKIRQYGSVYPMCRCIVLTELTRERTEKLKKWITGNEEGDVCTGSIKIKY